ncbi:MAG: hypothetical protein ACHBN1_24580 [Heteroscytonema crispum UTEX LB 1556]
MSPLLKIEKVICFSFVLWLLSTFFYSLIFLGLRQQALTSQTNGNVFTDAEETNIFQRERGGVRRTRNNSGRNTSKVILGDRPIRNT